MVVDKFVAVGSDSEERGSSWEIPLPVIFIKKMISPRFVGSASIEKLFEGKSVEGWGVAGFFNSGKFQKCWSEIDVEYYLFYFSASFDLSGSIGQKVDADRVFEGIAFVVKSMLTKVKSIVT